jgi:hypothetical protein
MGNRRTQSGSKVVGEMGTENRLSKPRVPIDPKEIGACGLGEPANKYSAIENPLACAGESLLKRVVEALVRRATTEPGMNLASCFGYMILTREARVKGPAWRGIILPLVLSSIRFKI